MCMKIDKEDLLRINKGFGGTLISSSSLDFAIDFQENNKLGVYKKLAYLFNRLGYSDVNLPIWRDLENHPEKIEKTLLRLPILS